MLWVLEQNAYSNLNKNPILPDGFICRNLKTYSVTKRSMSFVKQNYVWCEVKENSESSLYFHINSTKIKRRIHNARAGHRKIPYLTELRVCYLLPGILKVEGVFVLWHTVYYLN